MIHVRKSEERGHADHGWLDSHHTFSFGNYHDPRFTGFHDLLVINEDRVEAGAGFGKHGHRDMEIISYVVEGALEHQDSMGSGSVLKPGDIQRMSAGTGVTHSEFNGSQERSVHFLQVWIQPHTRGIPPAYEEKHFSAEAKRNQLRLIVSDDGREGSLQINQHAAVYASILETGKELCHSCTPGRHGWLQLIRGELDLNGQSLKAGDGAAISGESKLTLKAKSEAEFLLFDLPE